MEAKGLLVGLAIIVVLSTSMGCATVAPQIPLPSDINIIPPEPTLPEELRALSGRWEGKWVWTVPGRQEIILIVERIDPQAEEAEVIYSEGYFSYSIWSGFIVEAPRWVRLKYKVVRNENGVTLYRPRARFTLKKNRPNILEGWSTGVIGSQIRLKKVE
jgi:hypothetical protein